MKVKIQNSMLIKPIYEGIPPSTKDYIPLSVFDKATFDTHIAIIYAYRPPNPPNSALLAGLRKVLSEYRLWAGRFGEDANGERVILLNDEGLKFVEASVDCKLNQVMPLKPSPTLLSLHPSLQGVKELLQVQLTRFTCGSLVVGFTTHHMVADGHATSNFLVAWGKACRGLDTSPHPLHDRTIFVPRDPPHSDFEHRGVEFTSKNYTEEHSKNEDVVVHEVHFTLDILTKIKALASRNSNNKKPYSTFESLLAHLWRAITKARALDGQETTRIRIAVDGRRRMDPPIPDEYFGNLVLWALPSAKVDDFLHEPLSYASRVIHESIKRMSNEYYKSFIDFASHKAGEEGLVPTADADKAILCPEIEVDSWLRFPFSELDFGGGKPFIFMPSYCPIEGLLFLLPSFLEDGSIDAFVALSAHNLASFKEVCYFLED